MNDAGVADIQVAVLRVAGEVEAAALDQVTVKVAIAARYILKIDDGGLGDLRIGNNVSQFFRIALHVDGHDM